MTTRLALAFLLLSALAWPQSLRPQDAMVLVVGPSSNPVQPAEKAVVERLNQLRKQAGLGQLLLATMHYDQPAQARLCREVLNIQRQDLVCLAVVQLDAQRRPVKTLYKVPNVSVEQVEQGLERWADSTGVKLPARRPVPVASYTPAGGGEGNPIAVNGIDFDGDRKTDVFTVKDGRWLVRYAGRGEWRELGQGGPIQLEQMAFGDFDGDGKSDVFVGGTPWRVSSGGTGPLQQINPIPDPVHKLRFADFDGDGKTDVFAIYKREWKVSFAGLTDWHVLQGKAPGKIDSVLLGDFTGDGKADVLLVDKEQWFLSDNGRGPLVRVGNFFEPAEALRAGDFDGDGKMDVLAERRGRWRISWGARSSYEELPLGRSTFPYSTGDFDGDGRWDLWAPHERKWKVSWAAKSPLEVINEDPTNPDWLRVR